MTSTARRPLSTMSRPRRPSCYRPSPQARYFACLVLAICALSVTGCVRRRLFVNSNPAGALVYVDNEQIGTTPCAVDFIYYGTREIRLVKPGFETLTVNQPIPTPWYQYIPLDFVSENLVPFKIRDNRSVTYNMSPQVLVPPTELIARGEQLRQETLQGTVVPAGAISPVPPPGAVPTGPLVPTEPPFAAPPSTFGGPAGTSAPLVLPAPPGPLPSNLAPGPTVAPPASSVPLPSTTPTQPNRGPPIVSPPLR